MHCLSELEMGNVWCCCHMFLMPLSLWIGSVRRGLIRLAWDLNLLLLSSPVSLYFNLLYSLLNETLWNIQTFTWRSSVCVCVACVCASLGFVFSILECVSAVFDLSLSADKCGETGDRQTQEYIDAHLQTDGIRVGVMICYSRNLPSQLTMSPGWIRLIKPGRRRAFFFFWALCAC